ncbi:hypothetical protein EGC76_04185 [Pseudidiomarina gelatinasegens]|uniref:Uncharacterized protein n=1 Tax=Pseudidiomarina gelatinasegens TaxID=2487740 RepID=A0A443Z6G4_9GAMM|nr:hypothetical protein [Pseudidiomarina gelatinasegens]RWU12390.1 hypothetical protein EGC76_04185 [Pseudidiomarina gelatinasegens]
MKPFYFTLVLMLAAPLAAEELSKEDYLKEINKAFSRFYEATNGKTLSARIEALEELSVEYKDNQAVLDVLLQERGFAFSFMGNHQQALYAFDQRQRNSEELNTAVKELEMRDAVKAISQAADSYQVVMINEAHHVTQHRVLTYRLLKRLWDKGFRYLALEGLAQDAEDKLSKSYVHETSGYFTNEPLFANLVLYARQLGFQLVSYDYGSDIGTGTEARERSAVKNLREKVFDNEPDAKMVIHVGYSHINEDGWLAHYLKEALQLDPLTVNQTDFTERSHKRHEPESYTWLIENHDFDTPVVLTDNEGAFWSPTPEEYDVTVVWPRTEYSLNRPNWARLDQELIPVNLDWCELNFPCAVEVYRMGEEEEVPADRIIITESSTPIGIFISESSQLVKVTDSQGNLINTVTVPLKESD